MARSNSLRNEDSSTSLRKLPRLGKAVMTPEELLPAVVLADDWQDTVAAALRGPDSGVFRTDGARISHVGAGDSGVEDVEVSVNCPHCSGSLLIDVAHEDAFMTAFALIAEGDAASRSDEGDQDYATDTDVRGTLAAATEQVSVEAAMDPSVIHVRATASVASLAKVFSVNAVPLAFVTDAEDRPVGVVSPAHLLRALSDRQKSTVELKVEEIMTPNLYKLRWDAPLSQALQLFAEQRAERIAVVGETGKLKGLVLPSTVLTYLAQAS